MEPKKVAQQRQPFSVFALVLPFIVLLSIGLFSLNAQAQTRAIPQPTLIRPGDQEFEVLLHDKFPGIQRLETYRAVRPFLVFLRNNTPHQARAYTIEWEVRAPNGMITRLHTYYIQKHFLPVTERMPLVPGELRLISPLFNLSPSGYDLNRDNIFKIFETFAPYPPYSSVDIESIVSTVDGVIYEDGTFAGADHFQLLTRYQCIRSAERDEGAAVVKLMESTLSADDVISQLKKDAEEGMTANRVKGDYQSMYTLYKSKEAQNLLGRYERGGERALRERAFTMARYPRENVIPPPKQ